MSFGHQSSVLLRVMLLGCTWLLVACEGGDPFEKLGALPAEARHPAHNQPNVSKTQLGRLLFWDPVLSGDQDVACATCHHPSLGFADALPLSQGVGGQGLGGERSGGVLIKRNAPTVINTAFNGITAAAKHDPINAPMFWDNRAKSLESQAIVPILSKQEMRGAAIEQSDLFPVLITRLEAIPEYVSLFEAAFGDAAITQERIALAIASFERSLIANQSRFDDYMRGNDAALSRKEKDGLDLFMDEGCADCHNGPMLSDYKLHVVGTPESAQSFGLPEQDRGAGSFAFRTPSLRNLSLTAPYMHNGVFGTLEEVVEFYVNAAEGRGLHSELQFNDLDPEMRDLEIDDDEDLGALVSFLKTLDDDSFEQSVPPSVPSGLNPGGAID